jgi:hypothetical protein
VTDWWDLTVVPLPDGAVLPLTVHAADELNAKRCSWTIEQGGRVRRLR